MLATWNHDAPAGELYVDISDLPTTFVEAMVMAEGFEWKTPPFPGLTIALNGNQLRFEDVADKPDGLACFVFGDDGETYIAKITEGAVEVPDGWTQADWQAIQTEWLPYLTMQKRILERLP